MEKDDDEISIDFSKITGFFKRKGKSEEKKQELHVGTQTKNPDNKNDDDEINIDFGKIKNIFKKITSSVGENEKEEVKKEEPPQHDSIETRQEKKDDDEISIDFSKIKNIKNIFKKSKEESQSSDDITIDFRKFKNFFVKHRILFLILIPIFLSIFLRVQPAFLPITDQWATDNIINSLRSQIGGQINQQYPNLPAENKNILIEQELQKTLREQKPQIDQQIAATSNALKSRLQDDTGQTYLLAIDPYFWMRYARNIVENGHPGDELKDGKPWDNLKFAPNGIGVSPDMFHAYLEAYLFKFLRFFNRDLNLMTVIFFVPVLISALSVIPAFYITRKFGGNFGGFIAATIVAIHPSFLTRTVGGFADTDAYNVMFPLLITWIFLEALEAKTLRNNITLSAVCGLLVGFFSFTWGGWWYIFDFVLASTIFYIGYYSFVHKKDLILNFSKFVRTKAIKNSIIFLILFVFVSGLMTTYFVDYTYFTKFAKNPTGFAKLKEVAITTIWPNVFTTVAEQNPASLNNIIDQVGLGKFFFFLISLMGITLTLTRRDNKKIWFVLGTLSWYILIFLLKVQKLNTFLILISIPIIIRILIALWESDTEIDIKYAIILILWFIATTFASTKGVRFILLLVPAFAIGLGIAFGEFYRYANVWITKLLHVNKLVSKTTVIIMLLLLLIAPYQSAAGTVRNEIPSYNDAWAITLEKIKQDSQPDAIISSWWDFGHWFKYGADRAVTFDGTSQNTPQAYWIGKVLLTDNEKSAVGILRMLACSGGIFVGGSIAFEKISDKIKDESKTIDLVNEIIIEDREKAGEILREVFDEKETEEILSLSHCQPPENYFITSEDMVGKSGVWAHFGSWDFNRGLIYNTLKKKEYANDLDKSVIFLKERFDMPDSEAENFYYEVQSITNSDQANRWIAPWPGYAGSVGCSRDENIVTCGNGFQVNLETNEAEAQSPNGLFHPKKISIPTNEGIIVTEYNESVYNLQNGRGLGLTLVKRGDGFEMLQMDSDLTAAMFTRLFYQEGIGLQHFKKFSDEQTIFGGRIIVWKIDWEGLEKNIIEVPVPVEIEQTKTESDEETIQIENIEENSTDEKQETELEAEADQIEEQPVKEEQVPSHQMMG